MPGILHANLGNVIIHPQPPIPEELWKNDPNMQVVPSFVVEWDEFIVSGNFHFIAVAKKIPYVGWDRFKPGIEKIHSILLNTGLISKVTRYSIKYVDFFDESEMPPIDLLNININVLDRELKRETFTLHAELPDNDFLNVIKIVSSATLNMVGIAQRQGLILESDTLRILQYGVSPQEFMANHSDRLEEIHTIHKARFFNILSDIALERMEPEYDQS